MSPHWLRPNLVVIMAAAMLVLVSCGGDTSTETTPLPLQPTGLAVGGDVQDAGTEVAQVSLTEEQAKELAEVCKDAVEIGTTGKDLCAQLLFDTFHGSGEDCGQPDTLCLRAYDVTNRDVFAGSSIIEIVDSRESGSLCDADPGQVCMRVGIATTEARTRVLKSGSTDSPTGTTTTSSTSEPTPTPTSDEPTATSTASP